MICLSALRLLSYLCRSFHRHDGARVQVRVNQSLQQFSIARTGSKDFIPPRLIHVIVPSRSRVHCDRTVIVQFSRKRVRLWNAARLRKSGWGG